MKKLVMVATLVVCAGSLYAQGTLQFNNRAGTVVQSRVYAPEPSNSQTRKDGNATNGVPVGTTTYGGAGLQGTGFTAQLWAGTNGAPESSLSAIATSDFRTGAFAGFWNASDVVLPGVLPGTQATVQVRVWDNAGGTVTTWAAALTRPTLAQGKSLLSLTDTLGDGLLNPPGAMSGFRSFNLTQVPEPSTIALGVLGVGALLLRRRK